MNVYDFVMTSRGQRAEGQVMERWYASPIMTQSYCAHSCIRSQQEKKLCEISRDDRSFIMHALLSSSKRREEKNTPSFSWVEVLLICPICP